MTGRILLWASVIAGVGAAGFGLSGQDLIVPWQAIALIAVVVLVIELLATEYDRFTLIRKDRDRLLNEDIHRNLEQARRFIHDYAWDAVQEAIDRGRDDLWAPLRLETGGTEADWVGKVDRWETKTIEMLREHWKDEVDGYLLDTGLPASILGWRERLEARMDIKLNRLVRIMRRDLKKRYPDMSVEDV